MKPSVHFHNLLSTEARIFGGCYSKLQHQSLSVPSSFAFPSSSFSFLALLYPLFQRVSEQDRLTVCRLTIIYQRSQCHLRIKAVSEYITCPQQFMSPYFAHVYTPRKILRIPPRVECEFNQVNVIISKERTNNCQLLTPSIY